MTLLMEKYYVFLILPSFTSKVHHPKFFIGCSTPRYSRELNESPGKLIWICFARICMLFLHFAVPCSVDQGSFLNSSEREVTVESTLTSVINYRSVVLEMCTEHTTQHSGQQKLCHSHPLSSTLLVVYISKEMPDQTCSFRFLNRFFLFNDGSCWRIA